MGALAGFTHEVHQQQAMHAREGHEKFMVVLNKCNVMASSPNGVTLCVHFKSMCHGSRSRQREAIHEEVVRRDLVLLSQISKSSGDDGYFEGFVRGLLGLFGSDRRLLEMRGNLIIRQLCLTLSAEKIYRILADALESSSSSSSTSASAGESGSAGGAVGDDIEFAPIMVQNLNNNLITAPELQDLRKRLLDAVTCSRHGHKQRP